MTPPNSFPDPEQTARQAASHPWVERLARFGYAAKGVVYFIVGLLAAQAAFTTGGKITDTSGALSTIVTQPFGKFLLAVVTVGLFGYALSRFVQIFFDPDERGKKLDAKQIGKRLGYALSAFSYVGLGLTAIKLIAGAATDKGDSTRDWTARFMGQPFGRWLVGLAGLVVIGVGIYYVYYGYKAKFQRHFEQQRMSQNERKWTKLVGQLGSAARGIVFGIIGLFLLLAAIRENANEARGLGGALAALAQQPFGPWLLGAVSLGLIAYSVYSLFEARYRRLA